MSPYAIYFQGSTSNIVGKDTKSFAIPNTFGKKVVGNVGRFKKSTFGFYTNNAEEFQHHITEMEAEINDPNAEWIPSEQMWSEIKQEFSWLRQIGVLKAED